MQGSPSLYRSGFATEGVRADRVGEKLSPRAIVVERTNSWIDPPIVLSLTCDSRLAELRKGLGHPSGRLFWGCASGLGGLSGAALGGDPGRGERGSIDRAVVLNDRFDCRSRHAAHGSRDTRANSLRNRENLALSCESIGGGERAPEAEPRRQSRGIGGGRCLRMWAEYVSIEGALGPGKPLSLMRGRGKRS